MLGFDWTEVTTVLRTWNGIEPTPGLFAKLRVCEDEMLKVDSEQRERKKAAAKTRRTVRRSGRR
jgi:hypothetical protein